ncbi:MAG TPA: DUF6458 family protein [Acidimicrobiales bacterium]|nr:DUF6458 family protein [Acidimicrobiales bacterium]
MTIGASIFLIALGAVLAFAVDFSTSGIDINTIGVILMVVGVIGLALGMLILNGGGGLYRGRGRRTVVEDAYIDDGPVVAPRGQAVVEETYVDEQPVVSSRRRVVRRRDVL